MAIGFPLMPLVLMPVFTFLLMSFAYHSDMMLIKGAKLQCVGLLAVNAVVDRDKAHVVPSEYLHSVADLEIVAPQRVRSFICKRRLSVFNVLHHAGVGRTVKKICRFHHRRCSAGYSSTAALWRSSPKRFSGSVCCCSRRRPCPRPLRKAGVKGCDFVVIIHVHILLCVHVGVLYT